MGNLTRTPGTNAANNNVESRALTRSIYVSTHKIFIAFQGLEALSSLRSGGVQQKERREPRALPIASHQVGGLRKRQERTKQIRGRILRILRTSFCVYTEFFC